MKRSAREKLPDLTGREKEIVQLIWAGMKNTEIGRKLKISDKTVEAHRANIMKKWRVKNAAQLLRAGVTSGAIKVA